MGGTLRKGGGNYEPLLNRMEYIKPPAVAAHYSDSHSVYSIAGQDEPAIEADRRRDTSVEQSSTKLILFFFL